MTTYPDTYPSWLVALTISEVTAALVLSVMIIAPFGWWVVAGYGVVGLAALATSLAFGCTRCHYYGRLCGTGLGKVAALTHLRQARRRGVWRLPVATAGLDPGGHHTAHAACRRTRRALRTL
jgi:hypothetical protein